MTDLQKVIDHAIKNPGYGERLKEDPAGALADIGVESSPDRVRALQSAVDALIQARYVFESAPPTD